MKSQFVKLGLSLAAALFVSSLPTLASVNQAGISGVVRDSRGTPQVGAVVQLLRPDSSLVSRVFTDRNGHFSLAQIQPGTYSVEAIATAFLPALRQNLRIHTNTVVNLTLSTLFEAAQWLPAAKRSTSEPDDDWTWTLRSSVNRPLLRMLDSGPLVLVNGDEDGDRGRGDSSRVRGTRTRASLSSGGAAFGEGNVRTTFEVQHATDDSRALILRTRLSAGGTAAFDTVAGYRREVAPGNVMRTVLAIEDQPGVRGPSRVEGMQSLVLRSSDTLQLFGHLVADAGNEFEAIQLGRINVQSHPFAELTWNPSTGSPSKGAGTGPHQASAANSISYRFATSRTAQRSELMDAAETVHPVVSFANGTSQIEHGIHQQVSLEHKSPRLQLQVTGFHDHIIHPVVNGGGLVKSADANSGSLLFDPPSGLLRVAGQSYSGTGVMAEAAGQLGNAAWIKIECADGPALSLRAVPPGSNLLASLDSLGRRNVMVYAVSMSGNLHTTGTRWRTSYRWQPTDTVTAVAPFENSPEAAYFSIALRQPIHFRHILPNGVDAVVDVRNLLAEGYRPFVTADGSTLFFAQTTRAIQGGVSFSF